MVPAVFEARTEIYRIQEETFRLTATESDAVWRRLIGVERYLLRLWPAEV